MKSKLISSEEHIPELIHFITAEKVMLDYDLAKLIMQYSHESEFLKIVTLTYRDSH